MNNDKRVAPSKKNIPSSRLECKNLTTMAENPYHTYSPYKDIIIELGGKYLS